MRATEVLVEGITHIEDLPIEQFINSVKNISLYDISEKIDGANLHFGIDETGKFFTSREGKGGKRFYSYTDWGQKFWQTGFKSAHLALEKISKGLKAKGLLKPGDQIEVEVLFGQLPNTVPYSGDTNQLIMLRPVASAEDISELEERLSTIKKVTEGVSVSVKVAEVPYTSNGKDIDFTQEQHQWRISQTPKVDKKILNKETLKNNLEVKLSKIENFLHEKSGIGNFSNAEVIGLPLNKKPSGIETSEWRDLSALIKSKRTGLINKLMSQKLDIKEDLLNTLVRRVSSEFGPSIEEGGWVEGLVFRDPHTGEMFKLVDKDLFTSMNKFNWKIRNLLRAGSLSAKISDVTGRLTKEMSEVIGITELARSTSAGKYLKSLKSEGKDPTEFISSKIDFKKAKPEWSKIVSHYIQVLDRLLHFYESNKEKMVFRTEVGGITKKAAYDGEVDTKTKQSFAELNNDLNTLLDKIKNASDSSDLVRAFIGEKISSLGESKVITEGGHAFEGVGAIHISEIKPTLITISEILGLPYEELNNYTLGSVNKAEFSGDIDLAFADYEDEEKAQFVKNLEGKLGQENVKKLPTIISFKFPIQEYDQSKKTTKPRTGYVQVDLMFGDRDWNKFYYHSAGDASKTKGVHRNLMLAIIAKNMIEKSSEETDSFGRPVEQLRYQFSPTNGLTKIIRRSKKNKKGEWTKGQDTEVVGKPTKDPKMIAKMLFGPGAKPDLFNSLETMVDGVKKYLPEKSELIFKDFLNGLPEGLDQFEFPEEIERLKND